MCGGNQNSVKIGLLYWVDVKTAAYHDLYAL